MGMINYCKFILNLAIILYPLTILPQFKILSHWNALCIKAFEAAKELLSVSPVLLHYDTTMPNEWQQRLHHMELVQSFLMFAIMGKYNILPMPHIPCWLLGATMHRLKGGLRKCIWSIENSIFICMGENILWLSSMNL